MKKWLTKLGIGIACVGFLTVSAIPMNTYAHGKYPHISITKYIHRQHQQHKYHQKRLKLTTYKLKHHYQCTIEDKVYEYKWLYHKPIKMLKPGHRITVTKAIYHMGHKTPIGFETTNHRYIPAYAIVINE